MDYSIDPELRQCNLSAYYEANHIFAPTEPRPLPIVVVTGFLGSGKTTLLGQLLKSRANLRIAAVAHDLARSINVDAAWLGSASEKALRSADFADRDGSVVSLSGCACCDEFETSLKSVVKASLNGGVDQGFLDYVVLETSGAADPRRLIGALEQQFGPCTRARLDRVIAVVDAETAVAGGEHWLARNSGPASCPDGGLDATLQRTQLACADVVLLNKVDLISDAQREVAEARLKQLAPHARVLCCSFGKVPIVDVLDVAVAPSEAAPTVSHELTPISLVVSPGMEPRARPAAEAAAAAAVAGGDEGGVLEPLAGAFSQHAARHLVVEWSNEDRPVRLARLQELLALDLPAWQDTLRRGKGVLWIAEDPGTRWEWQVSGRLRYSCRRVTGDAGCGGGFGGASPRSSLVLIFAAETPKAVLRAAKAAVEMLVKEPEPACNAAAQQIAAEGLAFELLAAPVASHGDSDTLAAPLEAPSSLPAQPRRHDVDADAVVRFRVTGRERFGIPEDVDLTSQPYGVDVDGLNLELAQLVSASQGGHFLAVGEGMDPVTNQPVVALLWPEGAGRGLAGAEDVGDSGGAASESAADDIPPPPRLRDAATPEALLAGILSFAKTEAAPLLKKAFAHVQACRCGQ